VEIAEITDEYHDFDDQLVVDIQFEVVASQAVL